MQVLALNFNWASQSFALQQTDRTAASNGSEVKDTVDRASTIDSAASGSAGGQLLSDSARSYQQDIIVPFLESHCADCHLDGAREGGVELDDLFNRNLNNDLVQLWDRVLTQLRLGLMPPIDLDRPSEDQKAEVVQWVKHAVFQISPQHPHPGRAVIGRLNRVEYRNTVLDLMDYRIDTALLFPPDDTGHGFDNIGEVLTLSPLLMEKYIDAATETVFAKVPQVAAIPRVRRLEGEAYRLKGAARLNKHKKPRFDYHLGGSARARFKIQQAGEYRLAVDLVATEKYVQDAVDRNACRLKITCSEEVLLEQEFTREARKPISVKLQRDWVAGEHDIQIEVTPTRIAQSNRQLRIQIEQTQLIGPLDQPESFLRPKGYADFFEDRKLESSAQRRQSAERLLNRFASRAFRRPVSQDALRRLVDLAQSVWESDSGTFESGVSQALIAVLSSPSFIFKETFAEPSNDRFPLIDEYSLATRLSYFLWSTMPDERLIELADRGMLRENLDSEVQRMIADDRFESFYQNFIGQWLQTRDVMDVTINASAIVSRDQDREKKRALRERLKFFKSLKNDLTQAQAEQQKQIDAELRQLREASKAFQLTQNLRKSMQQETQMLFKHLVETDADLIRLIDCDYSFLNEKLAKHYGIDGIKGSEMRRVALKPEHHRGGLLTHGSLLTVTSNPDRTSPVKRGLFILENILGIPTGAPPPDIPSLEEAGGKAHGKLTLRESLARHRADASCSSCHNRMDPLGLALENFDALGRYRDRDAGTPVDASGTLITGEEFKNVQELKQILSKNHRRKFYRCLSSKVLTYALGRSVDYRDTQTIDDLVTKFEASGATAESLLKAVIGSPSFQRTAQ